MILHNKKLKIKSFVFGKGFVLDILGKGYAVTIGKLHVREDFSLRIRSNGKLKIHDNVFFNRACSINCMNSIEIGNNCIFGEGVKMYDHNHNFKDSRILIKDQGYSVAPIVIGENCWVGSSVTILKGVNIGSNVVIGANCLISEDIPNNSIVRHKANQIIEKFKRIK